MIVRNATRALAGISIATTICACGTTTKVITHTVTVQNPTTTTTTPVRTAAPTRPAAPQTPSCAQVLITNTGTRCRLKGAVLRVSHGLGPVHLRSLTAQITDVHTASTISDGYGQSATANGIYLIITLKITNRTNGPEIFDGVGATETLLNLGTKVYSEAFTAENGADQRSFITNDSAIQPGESATGDVIFDVPSTLARTATTTFGNALFIADFGSGYTTTIPNQSGLMVLNGT